MPDHQCQGTCLAITTTGVCAWLYGVTVRTHTCTHTHTSPQAKWLRPLGINTSHELNLPLPPGLSNSCRKQCLVLFGNADVATTCILWLERGMSQGKPHSHIALQLGGLAPSGAGNGHVGLTFRGRKWASGPNCWVGLGAVVQHMPYGPNTLPSYEFGHIVARSEGIPQHSKAAQTCQMLLQQVCPLPYVKMWSSQPRLASDRDPDHVAPQIQLHMPMLDVTRKMTEPGRWFALWME